MLSLKTTLRCASPRRCASWLRHDFARREDGTISLETVIMFPALVWAMLIGFSIHDAFRSYGLHQKAAYSLGDAVSRETVPLDADYLDGAHSAFEYLSHSQGRTDMRLSQLFYDADDNTYKRDWSEVRGVGGVVALTNDDVRNWHHKLPIVPDQERIVLLETWSDYDAPFNTGLTSDDIKTFVFTRPRYAPVVCFTSCN